MEQSNDDIFYDRNEWELKPIKQSGEDETIEMQDHQQVKLNQPPIQPKPEEICYYKSFPGKPDPEYDERCKNCNGFPVQEGCGKYTTQEHIKEFQKKYGLQMGVLERSLDFPV